MRARAFGYKSIVSKWVMGRDGAVARTDLHMECDGLQICFKWLGLYYSPVSTPRDFRMLAPIVLKQV